ncbi:E3 ubiquitin ligase [Marasmius crinis-equi]|uniref:E3 ubiquitin ligase n=1 Tax=Marasmius crinis-equi TaxID=585013 RepID=A0ABR3FDA8_9AGAR
MSAQQRSRVTLSGRSAVETPSESVESELDGNGIKRENLDDITSLRRETKRLRSVNCSITRKWTDAESGLKASRKECERLEITRREEAQKLHAERANVEFLKKWVVEVESRHQNVQQERDQLVKTSESLQAQSEFLHQQSFAQQQTITLLDTQRLIAEAKVNELEQAMTDARTRSIELSRIEDIVNCSICGDCMVSPWMLTCGHNYCFDCLNGWLKELLIKFKEEHPDYDPRRQTLYHLLTPNDQLQLAEARFTHEVAAVLVRKAVPKPEYTCPTCRSSIDGPPSQNYALKELVRAGVEARGIEFPPTVNSVALSQLWDEFWPQSERLTITL